MTIKRATDSYRMKMLELAAAEGYKVPTKIKFRADTHATAEVNHGRWVVGCPWCPNAQLGDPTAPEFLCNECLNDGTGKWVTVDYPDAVDDIEAVLAGRKRLENRNWRPGQSVGELQKETG